MLCEVPLTKEQQAFATDHHGLVYKFLNENHLPEDEFYDVVVFAYLKAVKDYFNSPSAQKFSFSTIATRQMKFRLYDYFRTQERRKRNMEVLSIQKNGELVIYDPWDGNIGTYTIDEAFYTGFLSAQGKGILKWVQYIV